MSHGSIDDAYDGEVTKQMFGKPSLFDARPSKPLTDAGVMREVRAVLMAPPVVPEHMIDGVPDCVLDRMKELEERERKYGV